MALAKHSDQRHHSIPLPMVDGLMRGSFIARKEFKSSRYPLNLLCSTRAIANGYLTSRTYPQESAALNGADIQYHKIRTPFQIN